MSIIEMRKNKMKPKRISVSLKRQITIPIEYYNALNIGDEVECLMVDNSIIIKPVKENSLDEYSEYILKEIIEEGYKNEEILEEFKKRRSKLQYSVKQLMKEMDEMAEESEKYATIEDIFGKEE